MNDFYIDKYEVTQAEYQEIKGKNPSSFQDSCTNAPVEQITWYDAVEFCNKLSDQEGLYSCYTGSGDNIKCNFNANGYRLPTEAEWEFVARSGRKSNGYKYAGNNNIFEVCWFSDNSGMKSNQVCMKLPNELNLYDLSGNIWKWCWDRYEKYKKDVKLDFTGSENKFN